VGLVFVCHSCDAELRTRRVAVWACLRCLFEEYCGAPTRDITKACEHVSSAQQPAWARLPCIRQGEGWVPHLECTMRERTPPAAAGRGSSALRPTDLPQPVVATLADAATPGEAADSVDGAAEVAKVRRPRRKGPTQRCTWCAAAHELNLGDPDMKVTEWTGRVTEAKDTSTGHPHFHSQRCSRALRVASARHTKPC
jgi:hypothetical protein